MGIQSLTATEASAASRFAGIRVDQNRTTGETSFSFLPPSSVPGLQIVTHETITTPPMTSELLKGQQFTIPFNLYTAMTSNPTVNNGADSLVQQRFDNPTVALDQLPGLEHQAHGVQDDRGLRGTLFRLLTPLLPAQDQEPDQRRPNTIKEVLDRVLNPAEQVRVTITHHDPASGNTTSPALFDSAGYSSPEAAADGIRQYFGDQPNLLGTRVTFIPRLKVHA